MYTGIVAGEYPIQALEKRPGLVSLAVALPDALCVGLELGASVGIDGICLSVTRMENGQIWFDAMQETLERTTLGRREVGDHVNVERSALAHAEVGGHAVSGHVDGVAEILSVRHPENNHVIRLKLPEPVRPYVFNKGFIAVNGCSLTVSNLSVETGEFDIWLIPETLRRTTFHRLQPGDGVNIEVDRQTQVIVDTVHRFLESHPERFRR